MPRQAFFEYADRGTLVVATRASELLGYALFDLPRQEVRLIHLCVDEHARGLGLAGRLISWISQEHPDRLGIRAKCRRDWPAYDAWPKLGFAPLRDVPGRSREGLPLTIWWKAHQHANLFNFEESSRGVVVAMDADVLTDLHSGTVRQGAEESMALKLPYLEDEIELVTTRELRLQLNRTQDPKIRNSLMTASQLYRQLDGGPQTVDGTAARLLSWVDPVVLASDRSLESDARMIAAAVDGGADVYVTRDANCRVHLGPRALEEFGLLTVAPSEVPVRLDEIRRSAAYVPVAVLGTGYSVAELRAGARSDLRRFLQQGSGERLSDFRALLSRATLAAGMDGSRIVVSSPSGERVGVMFFHRVDRRIVVDFLRVTPGPLSATLARQMAAMIRQRARDLDCDEAAVCDPHLSGTFADALVEAGFAPEGSAWRALVLAVCGPWQAVQQAAVEAGAPTESTASVPLPATLAAALEQRWWPAKIIDSDLPSFIHPIRPQFADELLGARPLLTERRSDLGLSLEQVFYRTPRMSIPAPSRALWYSSGKVGAVVASSLVVESLKDYPKTLHERFRRLGVWKLSDIEKVTVPSGLAGALRIVCTEVFPRPVNLATIRRMADPVTLGSLPGPRRVSARLFEQVYQEGQRL
jgi:GNAT superfamily N-acetyltransferase